MRDEKERRIEEDRRTDGRRERERERTEVRRYFNGSFHKIGASEMILTF